MSGQIVHIAPTYRFRTQEEIEAEAARPATTAALEPLEPALDLDGALDRLDAELQKLDELLSTDQRFPAEMASIEKKHEALTNQELDSIEAIQSRSAEMSKVAAMRELAGLRQKRLATAITTQEAVVLKVGGQASSLAEQFWWSLHTTAVTQAEREFSKLFYHSYESPEVLNKFKPLVLLDWLRIPDFRTGAADTKIVRARQLRTFVDRLREFERMTFQQISDELEALDRESREQAQRRRQIGSELAGPARVVVPA
jgi:hypothetical protein